MKASCLIHSERGEGGQPLQKHTGRQGEQGSQGEGQEVTGRGHNGLEDGRESKEWQGKGDKVSTVK